MVEWKVHNKLPFLDSLVHRFFYYFFSVNNRMYKHFSHSPLHVKRGVGAFLFLRALLICDPQYLDVEIDSLRRPFI